LAGLRLYSGGVFLLCCLWFLPSHGAAAPPLAQICEAVLTEWVENFDGVTPVPTLPSGWVSVAVNGAGAWVTRNGTSHLLTAAPAFSSPNLIYFNAYTLDPGASARFYYNAPLDLRKASGASLNFQMYHEMETQDNDRLQVQVSTDSGANWIPVGSEIPRYDGTTGWKQHSVSLDGYIGQPAVLVGLLGISAHGNDIHLDDLALEIKVSMATLLNENFDNLNPPGKLPSAWIISPVVNSGGDWKPYPETNHPAGTPAHSTPNLIYFNSFSTVAGTQTRLQYANGFDLRPATEAFLTFWMYHDLEKEGSNDRLQVQVSAEGGPWQNASPEIKRYDGYLGWKPYKVDLSPYLGQPQVMIGFLGISGFGNDLHLDNIALCRDYHKQYLPFIFN
jgi:hypothetical protein